jgi:hypothetical protein
LRSVKKSLGELKVLREKNINKDIAGNLKLLVAFT